MKKRVLVGNEDKSGNEMLMKTFSTGDFHVKIERTGEKILENVFTWTPNVIVVDSELPGLSGLELCRILKIDKRTKMIPILLVSSKSSKYDVLKGLEMGSDDYLVKPYDSRELVARVKVLLRRYAMKETDDSTLKAGSLTFDVDSHVVMVDGQRIILARKEFELLEMLLRKSDRVVRRDELMETIWVFKEPLSSRTIDVHIARIRRKLGSEAGKMIETIPGVGYCLRKSKFQS